MLDELVAAFNKSESCPLLEFYHQNYLENELLKEENEQRSKKLLNEFLAKERNPKNKAVKVNFRRFKSHQISISEGVYGRGRITDTRQIADLIKKQKLSI